MATGAGAILRVLKPARWVAVHATRLAVAGVLVVLGMQVMFGIAWDSTWHASVGRDKGFLSPPHSLMYGSAALAGLVVIALVGTETIRYHARSGVDTGNSIGVFRILHAPLGVLLAGFGIFTMVAAGPLDNYWHTLYGIFVHPWKPFHMMGIIGGAIWGLGNIYLWSALLVHARRESSGAARIERWGLLAAAVVLLRLMMTIAYPGLSLFQTANLGPIRFMVYPVVLPLVSLWLLVAVASVIRRPWTATATVAGLLGFHGLIQAAVPQIVRLQAAAEGRTFFNATLVPSFDPARLAPDLGLLLAAAALDLLLMRFFVRGSRRGAALGGAAGLIFWTIGAITVFSATRTLAQIQLPPAIHLRPFAAPLDAALALPPAIIAGALSAQLGLRLSEILRRNPR